MSFGAGKNSHRSSWHFVTVERWVFESTENTKSIGYRLFFSQMGRTPRSIYSCLPLADFALSMILVFSCALRHQIMCMSDTAVRVIIRLFQSFAAVHMFFAFSAMSTHPPGPSQESDPLSMRQTLYPFDSATSTASI